MSGWTKKISGFLFFLFDNFPKIYNNQNKETFDIEITKERDIKKNKALELKTLLGLKQYERAEVLFRNDKHIVIKNIIKQQV